MMNSIYANTFIYNKKLNTLKQLNSMNDVEKDVKLFANKIIYNKDKEIIKTIDNSKAIYNKANLFRLIHLITKSRKYFNC